jgi:hypothetical protein
MQTQDFTLLSEAQKFHAFGLIPNWRIEKTPMAETYQIHLGDFGYLISQRDKTMPRQFKTLDAAISAVQDIGFFINAIRGA